MNFYVNYVSLAFCTPDILKILGSFPPKVVTEKIELSRVHVHAPTRTREYVPAHTHTYAHTHTHTHFGLKDGPSCLGPRDGNGGNGR